MIADVPAGGVRPCAPQRRARLGTQVLADIVDVTDPARFATDFLVDAFAGALRAAGATILRLVVEEFVPQGVSIVVVLAESHASLHTWPEHGAVLVDVFACGSMRPQAAVEDLTERLDGRCLDVRSVERYGGRPAGAARSAG